MSSYIYDGTSIYNTKSDITPPSGPAENNWAAADGNAIKTAFETDTRSAILSGKGFGFTEQASAPVVSGMSTFLWSKNDGNFYFHRSSSDLNIPAAAVTSKGDSLWWTGSAWVKLAVGSDTQVLTADSAQTAGIKWAASGSSSTLATIYSATPANNVITVTASGTGVFVKDAASPIGSTLFGVQTNGGTNLFSVSASSVIAGNNLLPVSSGTKDIGSSGSKWRDAYFSGQINVGTHRIFDGGFGDIEIQSAGGATIDINDTFIAFSGAGITSGTHTTFSFTAPSDTGVTAGTESVDYLFEGSATMQHATGALTTQRMMRIKPRTYSFVGASTVTKAATVAIANSPIAGTNATITNPYALWVEAGFTQLDGGLFVTNPAATSGTAPVALTITPGAHTGLTASSEVVDVNFAINRTVQRASGAVTLQRAVTIQQPTYSFVGASTITNAATMAIVGPPIAGTNATITNKYGMMLDNGGGIFIRDASGGTANNYLLVQDNTAANTYLKLTSTEFSSTTGWKWDITNSRMGIGTAAFAPTATLHVQGSTGSNAFIRVDNTTGSTSAAIGASDTPTGAFVGALSNHTFYLRQNNTNYLELVSSSLWRPSNDNTVASGDNTHRWNNITSNQFTGTQAVSTSGTPILMSLVGAAHTGLTASTNTPDVQFNLARTVQKATGALTEQDAILINAPTYSFVGASTITNAATLAITNAPAAGTNATISNSWAIWTQNGASRIQRDAIGTTLTTGLKFDNTTNAVAGPANQYSPTLDFTGAAWTGSVTQAESLRLYLQAEFASAFARPRFTFRNMIGTAYVEGFIDATTFGSMGLVLGSASSGVGTAPKPILLNASTGGSAFVFDNSGTFIIYSATAANTIIGTGVTEHFRFDTSNITTSLPFIPTTTNTQTIGSSTKVFNQVWGTSYGGVEQTVAAAATVSLDPASGEYIRVTLGATGITTVNAGTGKPGQKMVTAIIQDGTGGRTIGGWSASFVFETAYTASSGANKRDFLIWLWDNTASKWYEIGRTMNM